MVGSRAAWALALSLCATGGAAAESDEIRVERFVRQWASDGASVLGSTDYSSALLDLNGDGVSEALVYLSGPRWCGSGGCHLLVLRRSGTQFELVTYISISRAPIRALESRSHGWRDIAVQVAGGGITRGYEARLRFDGESYPVNPSMVAKVAGGAKGDTLITPSSPMRRID